MAKEPQQQLLLSIIEELVKLQEINILLPSVVSDEFQRNRKRIVDDSRRSLSSVFKRVKEVVDKYGDTTSQKKVMEQLNDIDHRLPTLGDAVGNALERIEDLFKTSTLIETSEAAKLRVFEKGLQIKAPIYGKKNSIGDTILIETNADCISGRESTGHRFAFVTHNVNDFSDTHVNNKKPHHDLAPLFSKRKSLFFTNNVGALRRVRPDLVSELMAEIGESEQTQGSLSEILALESEFCDMVWYNRHQFRREKAERAVPLDYRAFAAIKHSALALDVYTWLAHRLCRICKAEGVKVSCQNLRDQFGQEYTSPKNFKHEFRDTLRQVWIVYPAAQVAETIGGIHLWPSPPPIQRTRVSMSTVAKSQQ